MAKLMMTAAEAKDRGKWLDFRRKGIGGSDAAAAVGLSRWKSPYQLWLEKTGQAEPEDLSGKEYVYWGTVLEEAVANRFTELTGKNVRRRGLLADDDCPFLLANVDRIVVGENAGLECKTANGFAASEWEDDSVPDAYYVQCQHYMMVTGCAKWYIAVLIGGNRFAWKEIGRNEDDIHALRTAEIDFWQRNVLGGIAPDADGSESCTASLRGRFPGGEEAPMHLPAEASGILAALDAAKAAKAEAEEAIREQQNKLCAMLGNFETAFAPDGRKVTWKPQKGRATVDSKRLREEQPAIYEKYVKIGKPMRVLRIAAAE